MKDDQDDWTLAEESDTYSPLLVLVEESIFDSNIYLASLL